MRNKQQKGFTLVEMMVAVGIFVMVAFVVSSVFISAITAYKKAQNLKRAIENLNFALNTVAFDIREGSCYSGGGQSLTMSVDQSCTGQTVTYSLDTTKNCLSSSAVGCLTSPEVNVQSLNFQLVSPSDTELKLVRVNIKGVAGPLAGSAKEKERSEFSIQTTLSQRNNTL